ncbi:hypothetical protein T484DRAFT_1755124 [Baffinella frigidus]|nr:hypothetical protein T484DRAFT_1755124 [Cryptophyta sp. CCMP2293]
MLTAASKGVATATTAHAWRSVEIQTLPEVGNILSRATTADFIKVGVVAGLGTDIGAVVTAMHDNTESIHGDGAALDPVQEVTDIDLVYTLNASDSHGMVYSGRVLMDANMRAVCAEDTKIPMSLYALRNLHGCSPDFDTDIAGIVEIMERAFGSDGVDRVQIGPHGVSLDSSGVKRVFPTDTENPTNHILKSQRNTTMLFDPDHTPSHTITVDSVRALRARPVHQRYLATQGVSIDQIGDGYQFQLVMSCSGSHTETELWSESPNCVSAALPVQTFATDEGYTPRQSVVHVFVDGGHFAVDVAHICNSNAARSLHLPVYAAMNQLASLGLCSGLAIKDAMCNGSMETINGDDSVPFVVLNSATSPLVAVFTSTFTQTGRCRCPENCHCHRHKADECEERDPEEIHVKHDADVKASENVSPKRVPIASVSSAGSRPHDLNIEHALPMTVRLALARQWGGMI